MLRLSQLNFWGSRPPPIVTPNGGNVIKDPLPRFTLLVTYSERASGKSVPQETRSEQYINNCRRRRFCRRKTRPVSVQEISICEARNMRTQHELQCVRLRRIDDESTCRNSKITLATVETSARHSVTQCVNQLFALRRGLSTVHVFTLVCFSKPKPQLEWFNCLLPLQ